MLGYCSGATEVIREVPGLAAVPLPPAISVGPAYGMVLLNAKPVTLRFAAFVMSEVGQAVLQAHGFDPVALTGDAQPAHVLLVQRAGQPPRFVTPERLAALHSITQQVGFATEHGNEQSEWTGPLLWDVLAALGAVDPAKPAEQVRLTVRVTGADDYTAVVALAEMAPQFAGRPIQLAEQRNGVVLPDGALRLIVPGEQRGGRSVRDVVRLDIE
jgi:hypothetical protein